MRTCSLACTKAHKQEKACTGKRSRTEMVTMSDFTERQLLSDYKFLEEGARLHDVAQRSEAPRPARQLPLGLQNFVDEVRIPPYASLLSILCWLTLAAAQFTVLCLLFDTTSVSFESFTCMALLMTKYHGVSLQTDPCQISLPKRFTMLGVFNSLQLLAELQHSRMHRAQIAVATCIECPRAHLKLSARHLAAIQEQR